VTSQWRGTSLQVVTTCSCPMGDICKRVVAAILEAQSRSSTAPDGRTTGRPDDPT
jgi:uncharacterized Zn finger protein